MPNLMEFIKFIGPEKFRTQKIVKTVDQNGSEGFAEFALVQFLAYVRIIRITEKQRMGNAKQIAEIAQREHLWQLFVQSNVFGYAVPNAEVS